MTPFRDRQKTSFGKIWCFGLSALVACFLFIVNLQKLSCSSDEPRVQSQVHLRSAGTKATNSIWSEGQIVSFLKANPNRAYFSRLFRDGGFRSGIEVGVADGRFSEHFLRDLRSISGFQWTMVEPFPNDELVKRYDPHTTRGSWSDEGLLDRVYHSLLKKLSLDKSLLDQLPDEYYDFIYLDGDHSYEGVKAEMPLFWTKVKRGGVLAGHDYCNYGEKNLPCRGCNNIPKCKPYTEYGIAHGKSKSGNAANQDGVVKAVQEWMSELDDPRVTLHHTTEDFTAESLKSNGIDYHLVITNTRNPSWFIVKPF